MEKQEQNLGRLEPLSPVASATTGYYFSLLLDFMVSMHLQPTGALPDHIGELSIPSSPTCIK